ncbi:hypothetical protein [Comamonas testosteroni]|uniref:hypothetical protein n=1 Tax=Comamonas testosteroni TaxID=285 RepID=UPI0006A58B49|nr:hypothetical protein [Comamonas testosteroni]KWT68280.1 hypothetical protein APV28_3151 [Comamonas testosteroni]
MNNENSDKKKTVDIQHGSQREMERVGVSMAGSETVSRYGSANAEFVKGYTGLDNETGQKMAKGLSEVSKHKLNSDPAEAAKNIKQQAGFSAEIASTSRDNAKAIIERSEQRTWRSDDLPEYGRNHNVVDRVQVLNGEIVEGSQSQMKFVGDRNQLFERIAKEDGKFARYRGVKLELPSEQFEGAGEYCQKQASELREQALKVESAGKPQVAAELRAKADNYEQLAENVRDSGLTTDEAIFYRKHPELATALDIARTSHGAGVEAAKYGAAVGACISTLRNIFECAQGKKDIKDVMVSVASDTGKAATLGYATGFAGSAIKGTLQQSSSGTLRALSATNAPALAVSICLSLGSSVKRYVTGEITEADLLIEVGEKGSGMLSGGMMAALGQIAIPIPVVGAAIGGMIGYAMSSLFYQSALDAARGAELSAQMLKRTQAIEKAARDRLASEQAQLDAFFAKELPELHSRTQALGMLLSSNTNVSADDMSAAINDFAVLLGQKLQFQNMQEFEEFMLSSDTLKL